MNDILHNLILSVRNNTDSTVYLEMIKFFLTKFPDKIGSGNQSPLYVAATKGSVDVVKLLIEHKVDLNQSDSSEFTPLMNAADGGYLEICAILLQNGAGVNLQNKYGSSALMKAARSGHTAVCKLLIESGAKIDVQNKDGLTALMLAAMFGSVATCKLLIDAGADLLIQDKNGKTAFDNATHNAKSILKPVSVLNVKLGDIVIERTLDSDISKEQLEKIVDSLLNLIK